MFQTTNQLFMFIPLKSVTRRGWDNIDLLLSQLPTVHFGFFLAAGPPLWPPAGQQIKPDIETRNGTRICLYFSHEGIRWHDCNQLIQLGSKQFGISIRNTQKHTVQFIQREHHTFYEAANLFPLQDGNKLPPSLEESSAAFLSGCVRRINGWDILSYQPRTIKKQKGCVSEFLSNKSCLQDLDVVQWLAAAHWWFQLSLTVSPNIPSIVEAAKTCEYHYDKHIIVCQMWHPSKHQRHVSFAFS